MSYLFSIFFLLLSCEDQQSEKIEIINSQVSKIEEEKDRFFCEDIKTTECNNSCIDLKTDPNHCGSCEKNCSDQKTCQNGECKCKTPLILCQDECTDILIDPNHCGICGTQCSSIEVCADGVCACPKGTIFCNGECITLDTKEHCGKCNHNCQEDEVCFNGNCEIDCQNLSECNDKCIDLSNDSSHCGECENSCGNLICSDGECICNNDLTKCENKCIAILADSNNCGNCDELCSIENEICQSNQCGKCMDGVCKISYASSIKNIFTSYCVDCHGQAGNLDLSSYQKIKEGGISGKAFIPHDPENSILWQRIKSNSMPPPPFDELNSDIKYLIKRWIEEGADNN